MYDKLFNHFFERYSLSLSESELEEIIELSKNSKLPAKKDKYEDDAKNVLEFLNLTAKKKFRPVLANLKFIKARLKEHPIEILKQIIQLKTFEWKDDFKMNDYLRPETLFNQTKFETYVQKINEIKANPEKFKHYVEQRNSEARKQAAKHYDPLDAMPD